MLKKVLAIVINVQMHTIFSVQNERERERKREKERGMHYTMESMLFTLFNLEQHVVAFK